MSTFYEIIGRVVVLVVRRRFKNQLRIVAGTAAAVALIGAYLLASRDIPEG